MSGRAGLVRGRPTVYRGRWGFVSWPRDAGTRRTGFAPGPRAEAG